MRLIRILNSIPAYIPDKDLVGDYVDGGNIWEPEVVVFIKSQEWKNKVVLDLGASFGYFALQFAFLGSKVIAVDLCKDYCDCIKKSNPNIIVINKVVVHIIGQQLLVTFNEGMSRKSIIGIKLIESTTIDEISNEQGKIDFIKMDIEGDEELAWMGSIETRKKYQPSFLIEYHGAINYSQGFLNELERYLPLKWIDKDHLYVGL